MKTLLLVILSALCLLPLQAERPKFGIEFVEGETYVRFGKGTKHGLQNDFMGPGATRGVMRDVHGKDVGTFETLFANDFETIARVSTIAENVSMDDVDHLAIPELEHSAKGLHYIKFHLENSHDYFLMDKGIKDKGFSPSSLKRGTKGNLYDKDGNLAAICVVEIVSDHQSLGRATQFNAGYFAKDVVTGHLTGYMDQILGSSGFVNIKFGNMIMILIAFGFLYLAISKDYEPLLLVPIAFGVLIGNMPMPLSIFNSISVYMIDPVTHEYVFNTGGNSVFGMIYVGVKSGFLPPLIFLGIGAMTDFSTLLSNPKSLLLGAAAQFGIFAAFLAALWMDFSPQSAASIGIIGGADGPTAIFTSSRLAPSLIGPIAIAAYSYMAMVPVIQPPIMKLLTTRKERLIRMVPGRRVNKVEKIVFPIGGLIVTCLVAPGGLPLLGPLFFGNLLRESGVTGRLAKTASSAMVDICTIFIGLGVGASTNATVFLTEQSIKVFVLGCVAFAFATAGGVAFAKLMNVFSKEKVNPLIGAAGVSAVPDAARLAHQIGQAEDPTNFLLQHAMGPNVAGVIGSAIAAGLFLGLF